MKKISFQAKRGVGAGIALALTAFVVTAFQNCSGFSSLTQGIQSSTSYSLQSTSPTKFGMFYLVWHCGGQPVQDVSRGQLGAFGSFHWWSKPDLGYYCPTRDRDVLRRHAELLRDAGIDFIFIDGTNFSDISNPQAKLMLTEPLQAVMEEFSKVDGAPKITVWMPLSPGATVPDAVDAILSQFPQMLFNYQGKPLMEVVSNSVFPVDQALWNRFSQKYTLRQMWTGDTPTQWSFMSPCQGNFKATGGNGDCNQKVALGPDGQVEQISVTSAYQVNYMSDTTTATPKFGGLTLKAQFKNVDRYPSAPLVMITGWNEWIAQRFCINGGPSINCNAGTRNTIAGNPVFVDQFNDEYSRDIEPGGANGDMMYRILKSEIANRKQGQINIVGNIDAITGGNGQVVLSGWACATTLADSVPVHVYAGGAAGAGGHMITSGVANLASEAPVGAACVDPTNSPHRFSIVIDAATANANLNQPIYVHGISPVGRDNSAIAGSGSINMPSPGSAPAQPQPAQPAPVVQQPVVQQPVVQQPVVQQPVVQQPVVQQPVVQQPVAQQPVVQQPAAPVETFIDIHRFIKASPFEHFFTASVAEGLGAGFQDEGVAFRVLASQLPGSHPLYRCLNSDNKHFVSGDAACEGQRNEGTYGFIYDQGGEGRVALYRSYASNVSDHLATSNPNEGAPDYRNEGIIGYVK